MAEKFRIENGLLLSDGHTLVELADGCAAGGELIPGVHEVDAVVPCPGCAGEHRVSSALVIPTAHNITISEVEPEDEPGD
ncbi:MULTISPECIES: hypothetical protein [unclassified Pseudonocardia]|uniref:hypothetical protein n=1 Tax=unclassified Pseudonocardia TaxID=2619320 RepID=UPI0002F9FE4C|nr:hypothetical protein [Pseudonocardia sp. Ae707_Ps1]OLM09048.1 hypothetical protein Ae707Ps1_5995 [Pseudonocardia sp. Ae707_Ps1]